MSESSSTVSQSSSVDKPTNKQPKAVDKPATEKPVEPPAPVAEPAVPLTVDDLPKFDGAVEPTFWDDVRDSLPDWLDEILAIALLIFGILSFLALFDTSGAAVAIAWAEILRQLFGLGSLLAVEATQFHHLRVKHDHLHFIGMIIQQDGSRQCRNRY